MASKHPWLNIFFRTGRACIVILAVEFTMIWYFRPTAEELKPVETWTGTYDLRVGQMRTPSVSYLIGSDKTHIISCDISFLGTNYACSYPEIQNKTVEVQIARYRSLNGLQNTVVRMATIDGHVICNYSGEELARKWRRFSHVYAYIWAFVFGLVFMISIVPDYRKKYGMTSQ